MKRTMKMTCQEAWLYLLFILALPGLLWCGVVAVVFFIPNAIKDLRSPRKPTEAVYIGDPIWTQLYDKK